MRHNQNRRSRGRNNRKGPNPLTRSFESNGPDVKVRGTAAHVADKYMTLARDAQSSGDPVAAENYLQHAEHYNRIVMAAQAQFQQSQPQFREADRTEGYDDDRQMNGRPRDRFDFNGADGRNDDEGGDDRFDGGGGGRRRPRLPPADAARLRRSRQSAGSRYAGQSPARTAPRQRYDRPRYDRQDNRRTIATDNRDRNDSRTIATTGLSRQRQPAGALPARRRAAAGDRSAARRPLRSPRRFPRRPPPRRRAAAADARRAARPKQVAAAKAKRRTAPQHSRLFRTESLSLDLERPAPRRPFSGRATLVMAELTLPCIP